MDRTIVNAMAGYRQQWLALLDKYEVGHPKFLQVVEVSGGLAQATVGEPPGRIALEGAPANVLMFNVSPVQGLRQAREGRSFTSNMLHGEMTLMPSGVASKWSWNSTCDRLDVAISPFVFGDGNKLEVADRFVFRDGEMEEACRRIFAELSRNVAPERLYVESLTMKLAETLLLQHSSASQAAKRLPSSGLTRRQARHVLDYVEANLSCELTLGELARIAGLSLHHFARMFRRTLSMAPYRYVLERRVERAKWMLRSSGASLVEIGLSTGFYSHSHFASTFRRMVGVTPTEFRGSINKQRR
jgi:AraC family transcriptional regulator